MKNLFLLFSCVCLWGLQTASAGLPASPSSDPAALALLTRTVSALTAGNRLDDVKLKGTVHWRAGSEDLRGPVDLEASSSGRSQIHLDLGNRTRVELFSGDNEDPSCAWTDKDKTTRPIATHNCWTPGAWFFPMLSILPAQQRGNIVITYVGRETQGGLAVEHIQIQRVFLGRSKISGLLSHLSTMDLYLDGTTMLPATLKYFVHPDDDANQDIPTEIRFSDYREVSGIKIPFHVEKLISGSMFLEIEVSSANFNIGVLKD